MDTECPHPIHMFWADEVVREVTTPPQSVIVRSVDSYSTDDEDGKEDVAEIWRMQREMDNYCPSPDTEPPEPAVDPVDETIAVVGHVCPPPMGGNSLVEEPASVPGTGDSAVVPAPEEIHIVDEMCDSSVATQPEPLRLRRAETWNEDGKCYTCSSHFTVLLWKHHCRACGEPVCDPCSKRRMMVGDDYARVCNACASTGHRVSEAPIDKAVQDLALRQQVHLTTKTVADKVLYEYMPNKVTLTPLAGELLEGYAKLVNVNAGTCVNAKSMAQWQWQLSQFWKEHKPLATQAWIMEANETIISHYVMNVGDRMAPLKAMAINSVRKAIDVSNKFYTEGVVPESKQLKVPKPFFRSLGADLLPGTTITRKGGRVPVK